MKNKTKLISTFLIFLSFSQVKALDYTEIHTAFSDIFSNLYDKNEGTTSFRSLLIPFGGRAESLGCAFTGLCDDITYLHFNPSAGALQSETQLSLFHNTWIADSNQETIAYTTRFKKFPDMSFGTFLRCFYVPFTEYNLFGDRVASSYYSETIGAVNFSYNFLSGYNFKGIAIGTTLKAGWRNIPDYTDNNSNAIIQNSGLEQSGFAIMADLGLMLQFNFLKYYSSREPNVRIGFSAQNFGIALTGFGNPDGVKPDDQLPSSVSTGISFKFIKPITLSIDFTQPLDFMTGSYLLPYEGAGIAIQFTDFLSALAGFQFKGGNPRISMGFEFEVSQLRFNANYTLDFTSSVNPVNKLSISTKIMLGDQGRSKTADAVDYYYMQGLQLYAKGEWQAAIDAWNEALKLNRRFDPAISGIQSARHQIEMFEKIRDSLLFD